MATQSSTLAWKIPWTEDPTRGLQSTGVAKSRTRLSNFTSLHFTSIQSQDIGQYIQSENVSQLCDSLQPHGLYVAHEATLSMGQEYWSGFPFPSPGDLPDPGICQTLGSNPGLLHWRQIPYCLRPQRSPQYKVLVRTFPSFGHCSMNSQLLLCSS